MLYLWTKSILLRNGEKPMAIGASREVGFIARGILPRAGVDGGGVRSQYVKVGLGSIDCTA